MAILLSQNFLPFFEKGIRVDWLIESLGIRFALFRGKIILDPLSGKESGNNHSDILDSPLSVGAHPTHLQYRTPSPRESPDPAFPNRGNG
jgi:hypothetical protein